GFAIASASAFERFAMATCKNLFCENGEHPRESISGRVYTPVFYPPENQLLWHNENSFNHQWPEKILFGCAQPAQQGGETPLVDSREVYKLLPREIKERFLDQQIKYVRNYGSGLGLDWQTVFRTSSRAKVEEGCRRASMQFEWKEDGGLRT